MNLSDYIVSVIRTTVPTIVGLLVLTLASYDIEIDGPGLTAVLTGLLISVYYAVVRLAERKWPQVGWLLGYKATLDYGNDGE